MNLATFTSPQGVWTAMDISVNGILGAPNLSSLVFLSSADSPDSLDISLTKVAHIAIVPAERNGWSNAAFFAILMESAANLTKALPISGVLAAKS